MATGASEGPVLKDAVVLILHSDAVHNAKEAIKRRVQANGGRVVPRLGKEVTHVVFERRRGNRPSDKQAEQAAILDLYHRLDKMEQPPVVVSPLWVEECISQGRRLPETRYTVARPKENLLAAPGRSTATVGQKRKHRSSGPAPPKPAEEFDLDLGWLFSSSQQLQGGGEGEGADASPAPGSVGARRLARLRRSRTSLRAKAAGAAQAQRALGPVGRPGTATQAVANILAIDLPGDVDMDGGDGDDDDLDTPLSVRCARHSLGTKRQPGAAEAPAAGPAAKKPAVERKSRLVKGSSPAKATEEAKGAEKRAEAMEEEEEKDQEPARKRQRQNSSRGASKGGAGAASRFSMRNLRPEKPLLVVKSTPPVETKPAAARTDALRVGDAPIPIPEAIRVTSPWNDPTPPTASQDSGAPARRASFGGFAAPQLAAARVGTPTLPTTVKKAIVREKVPTPWSVRPWDKKAAGASQQQVSQQGPGPSRLGTQGAAEEEAAVPLMEIEERVVIADDFVPASDEPAAEEAAAPAAAEQPQEPQKKQIAGQENACANKDFKSAQKSSENDKNVEKRRCPVSAPAAPAAAAVAEEEAGPRHGLLSVTSVLPEIMALCRSATQRLRGLRLCADGREEGATHLIIGEERRTMKAMLAVASGAQLMDPAWVTASLEAGRWLPEGGHRAAVRFVAAADAARARLADKGARKLLAGRAVYVVPGRPTTAALRRVAAALGAGAAKEPGAAAVCVVPKGGVAPAGLRPDAVAVAEEWLFEAAETYTVPEFDKHPAPVAAAPASA